MGGFLGARNAATPERLSYPQSIWGNPPQVASGAHARGGP